MTENMGLNSFRKKTTERATTVSPNKSNITDKTMPNDPIVNLNKKKSNTDKDKLTLPKSIRIGLNTHTAISTIATLEDKKIYEIIDEMVDYYINSLPPANKKLVKASVETKNRV